jgi:hypothetical protein
MRVEAMKKALKSRPLLDLVAVPLSVSIRLCVSCIFASGIGGEVRAIAQGTRPIFFASGTPICSLRSIIPDVLEAILEAITA